MKVVGYMPLHYGAEYLRESLLSVIDHVDKFYILYTEHPSYGKNAKLTAPETEGELKRIAYAVSDKIQWVKGSYHNEGEHRRHAFGYAGDADLIMTLDADEVLEPTQVEDALRSAYDQKFKRYGINGFINFWKSFDTWCQDGFRPVRIHKPKGHVDDMGEIKLRIYHFGYCQKLQTVQYKWQIHGHQDELRPNWMTEIYMNDERTKDLHPVALKLWNAQKFDKSTMPDILKQHPNFNKKIVM